MGFLKIFTRRPGKTDFQNYDTRTEPGTPQQGARPVTDQREETSEIVTSLRQEQEWPRTPSTRDDLVLTHRGHLLEDRPETATSNYNISRDCSPSAAPKKRELRRPPVSFRKPTSLASLSTASQDSVHFEHRQGEIDTLLGMRRRNSSKASIESAPFKDLLDAQEEIRPTDFRSRVRATGVRDYGEDVADRNIARDNPNGIYEIPIPLPASMRYRSMGSTGYFVHPKPAYIKGQMLGNVLRESSSLSEVSEVKSFPKRNKQRLSLNTYVPSGMTSPFTPRSANASSRFPEGVNSKGVASRRGRPVSVGRQYNFSHTATNFSVPKSPMSPQRTVLEWKEFLSRHGYDDLDDKFDEAQAQENVTISDLSSHPRLSNANFSQTSLSRNSRRQSYQSLKSSLRSSLASSVASRPPSIEITPLAWPRSKHDDILLDTKGIPRGSDGAEGRPQSRSSDHHSRSNNDEVQHDYYMNTSLDSLSSPPEGDEQKVSRPWSDSAVSKSESTTSSKVFSASSGRPHSRQTACTSLDSTHHGHSPRKSEDSSISASNDQRGTSSGWSPTTTRSTGFNIDDYVSSDDDSFTTAKKRSRITAEGEEDLLFKPGYGLTGVALPGLAELEEDPAYLARSCRSSRTSSVSSNGSAAIASSPVDNRFSMAREIPTLLRHTRSDPEMELYSGTFGQRPMPDSFKDHARSPSAGEARDAIFAADIQAESQQAPVTTTVGSENGIYDEVLPSRRGLVRLSALGNLHSGDVDSRSGPAQLTKSITGEKLDCEVVTAMRLRKEEKARKRAEDLKSSREKRLTRTFTEMGENGELAKLKEQLNDANEDWDQTNRRYSNYQEKEAVVESTRCEQSDFDKEEH